MFEVLLLSVQGLRMDTHSFIKKNCIGDNYELQYEMEEKLKEHYPEVLLLLNKLYRFIQKQQRKIRTLKLKLKTTHKDVAIQTDILLNESKNFSEEIKEAAEIAVQNSGFVYEETSGLYYDYNTGYYYNAELGLYYDGNSGTYLTYNQETESYEFHSQHNVPTNTNSNTLPQNETTKTPKRKIHHKENAKGYKRDRSTALLAQNDHDLEEGECSDSSHSGEEFQEHYDKTLDSDFTDIGKGWPPCMRIIVKSSSVPKMKEGSLYIITYQGGTLGREGDHSIVIPDINISKHHLKFEFNKQSEAFVITDLGSRNGTLLNGKRISGSKQESEATEVAHGSCIQIGSTTLLCHIHTGNETCGHCEPGLLQTNEAVKDSQALNKSQTYKCELQKLRKKFGVNQLDRDNSQLSEGYTDRAHIRRQTVGSLNEHEKTEMASIDKSISSENKGFKLLSKMGWSEGTSLGKEGTGVINPVEVQSTVGTTGMGYNGEFSNYLEKNIKDDVWQKTQNRYQKLPSTENIFEEVE